MKKRLLSVLLALALLVMTLLPMLPVAEAVKVTKSRAIAIVFDNSGSMYGTYNSRWCHATYAMEVFAAMMNEEDTLYVYPMNPIEVDGEYWFSARPLVIEGPEESDKIHRINTVEYVNGQRCGTGTPVQAVKDAYEGLTATTADEKFLIVLTDGTTFHWYNEAEVAVSGSEFSREMETFSQGVEQIFLGIDAGSYNLPSVRNAEHQDIRDVPSHQVLQVLTDVCNRIFGRDLLNVTGKEVTFDVSMSKLIVFIQGKDISNVALSGGTLESQRQMQYSEPGGRYNRSNAQVEEDLQGMLVTYTDLDAGTYQLTYSGNADSVAVYYEPDVDLQIQLKDSNGNDVDPNNVAEGTYQLVYTLVDKYGNPTDSQLLSGLNFTITYPHNGTNKTHTDNSSGVLEFEMKWGDVLNGPFQATYLKDYTISKTGADLGWPSGGIRVKDGAVGAVTVEVTGGADHYLLSKLEQEAVYQVRILSGGQPITGSDLDRVTLDVQLQDGNALVEQNRTADGFTVRLKYNGGITNTQCGDQSLVFTATCSNRDGVAGDPGSATKAFTLEDDSQMLDLTLVLEQDYYVISDLDDSAPILAKLTIGGKPLTREQFAKATVSVTIDGLQYDVRPDEANSCYVITLSGGESIATGEYTVQCHVDGVNGAGNPAQADATAEIELQKYPLWLRILFWVLVTLLVAFLIWSYLNAKVLPKDIRIAPGGNFNVDGETIPGQISCTYTGKNKKRGTLRVNSPQCMSNPLARCGFTLELEAISPRRTRSAARSVMVRGITPMNSATTQTLQVGTRTLAKDPVTERLTPVGLMPGSPVDVRIGNNANTMIMAEVMDMNDGNGVSCTLTARLKFY